MSIKPEDLDISYMEAVDKCETLIDNQLKTTRCTDGVIFITDKATIGILQWPDVRPFVAEHLVKRYKAAGWNVEKMGLSYISASSNYLGDSPASVKIIYTLRRK